MAVRYVTAESISEPGRWFVIDRQTNKGVTKLTNRPNAARQCKKLNAQEAALPGGQNKRLKG